VWSPEGDRLFFHEEDDLFQVEVDAGDGLRLSAPRKVLDGRELGLFLSRRIAVAPGGERIIASRRLDPEGEEAKPEVHGILVVENWLEELR
jgi:hypothetical protein